MARRRGLIQDLLEAGDLTCRGWRLTVAGPSRNCTGFPIYFLLGDELPRKGSGSSETRTLQQPVSAPTSSILPAKKIKKVNTEM